MEPIFSSKAAVATNISFAAATAATFPRTTAATIAEVVTTPMSAAAAAATVKTAIAIPPLAATVIAPPPIAVATTAEVATWAAAVTAATAAATVVATIKDKDVVTLHFAASGAREIGTQGGLNTQLIGYAVLYLKTGKIDFLYDASVLKRDGSSCDVPIKIMFKLCNARGHLLEALEVRTGNGNNQSSVFSVSKEILSMTARIDAMISYNL